MIAQSSDFPGAMEISYVAFRPVPGTGNQVNFDAVTIDMGYCASDQLTAFFDDNYVSGTKHRVFERTSVFSLTATEPWTSIELDESFWYDPAQGNLIIEINWPGGSDEFYSYDYATQGTSLIKSAYGSGVGDPFTQCPNLLLEGPEAFNQTTFAAIKATFR